MNDVATAAEPYQVPRVPDRMMVDPVLAIIDRYVCDPSVDANKLTVLLDQQFRFEDRRARRKFDEALAAAMQEMPSIKKTRRVGYDSKRTGDRTSYQHEDLAVVIEVIRPVLAKHGIHATWRVKTDKVEIQDDSGKPANLTEVTCVCVLSGHGHREEGPPMTALSDKSGSKNNVQAIGSTQTYLERYTLKAAVGLAATDDDDGRGGVDNTDKPKLTAEQVGEIKRLLQESGASEADYLKHIKHQRLEDIGAHEYDGAVGAIKRKIEVEARRAMAAKEQTKKAA